MKQEQSFGCGTVATVHNGSGSKVALALLGVVAVILKGLGFTEFHDEIKVIYFYLDGSNYRY